MTIAPLELHLPDGPAVLVPGSLAAGQPRYVRDGMTLDLDVTIPPELAVAGWIWQGSFLRKPGVVGIAICTKTFGVPGVFDRAREHEQIRAEMDSAVPKQPVRRRRGAPDVATPVQIAMELT